MKYSLVLALIVFMFAVGFLGYALGYSLVISSVR